MQTLKHIVLFTKINFKQLGRKWLSLPLLLLLPFLLISLLAFTIISFIDVSDTSVIKVGLVDLDQSEETELIVELLEESAQLGDQIAMNKLEEQDAIAGIENNELSSYIIFPSNFFQKLMEGQSSELSIIGNPKQPLESQLINELVQTITRHIRSSQANILTINYYAKQMGMENEERNDFLFEQFTDFFFYVLGGDQVLDEELVTNNATASPTAYFSLAGCFTLITIWLFALYIVLHRDSSTNMKQRMKLYGVTDFQQAISVGVVVLFITSILSFISFVVLQYFFASVSIADQNYYRVGLLLLFHSIIFLHILTLIDWWFSSKKLSIFVQTIFTGITILLSGAIIPALYFPVYIQDYLEYSFSYQSFYWIEQILLNGRFYADLQPLILFSLSGFFLLLICSFWKERVRG